MRMKDFYEKRRLEHLAGGEGMTKFLLGLAFRVKPTGSGNETLYPGWDVVERNRRDGGIMIKKEPVPLNRTSPVVLYPEDRAYADFI